MKIALTVKFEVKIHRLFKAKKVPLSRKDMFRMRGGEMEGKEVSRGGRLWDTKAQAEEIHHSSYFCFAT